MKLISALWNNAKHLFLVSKEWILRVILLGVVILSAYQYAQQTFESLPRAQMIMMGHEEKPYVYRALVPWLARLLVTLGLPADAAFTVIIVLSALGLLYGIKYLLASFRKP